MARNTKVPRLLRGCIDSDVFLVALEVKREDGALGLAGGC